ncbi:dihydroxyacetone kinase subunit DhaK [Nitratireductor indicus]|uniref:PTS-dependent dihydroxyacetone kinase,dihydroxyacetone binding subunit dhaK n=1 Tax=Nitratireductor indicus C115 TaxID=1231190 RepID=K2PSV5_9HYPH|nr:dihydroxyacetone kinase subunit DhaK [Nitratireductor indicus]EKF44167.1 PTS-dependent dihydroxyacetone kinase,dihydroxyacetone binding subunit dhaK [Nitratireductor indicus C115]MDS1137126.1 dihydroxyacetone kinase subunit DhaK [Nitratireductor indicus]SFQ24597.1 dihydroxyacetone kinase, N-terminal domain [Nitratireductor indicus]
MKKLINDPNNYVEEMLAGLVSAHASLSLGGESGRCVSRSQPAPSGQVGIATGGGSGHLPLFTGYVGEGFTDACAIGNVFEGPTAQSCIDAIRAADHGAGVLCLYGNYGGDRMNFDTAIEMAELDDIACDTVLGTDDVASAAPEEGNKRRGVAGIVLVYKAAGAAAAEGRDLAGVAAAARKANAATRSIGVALAPCQVPTADAPNFEIADNEMEFGMGIHGEPGIWRSELSSADKVADGMLERLLPELDVKRGDKLCVLVNGLGATPLEELYILWRRVGERLAQAGIEYLPPVIGNYVTSMEMAGASLSLMKLDDELEALMTAPAKCPFWSVS